MRYFILILGWALVILGAGFVWLLTEMACVERNQGGLDNYLLNLSRTAGKDRTFAMILLVAIGGAIYGIALVVRVLDSPRVAPRRPNQTAR
jgi:hypothetical protein